MTVTILFLGAIVLFLLAAFGVSSRIGLSDVGLACLAGALLLIST